MDSRDNYLTVTLSEVVKEQIKDVYGPLEQIPVQTTQETLVTQAFFCAR